MMLHGMLLAYLLSQTQPAADFRLTAGGWLIMLLSIGFVTGLLAWCILRVMAESSAKKLHSQVDIDTRDTSDA